MSLLIPEHSKGTRMAVEPFDYFFRTIHIGCTCGFGFEVVADKQVDLYSGKQGRVTYGNNFSSCTDMFRT